MPDFKPSQVQLENFPLVGTMGKAEIELAAAMIIRTLAAGSDAWEPVRLVQVIDIMSADYRAERAPMVHWLRNPFVMPSYHLLCARGFAKSADLGELAYELTEQGLAALKRYVRAEAANG